jgi:Cu(I)/Ag(I) efflux system membrane fusion protein
MNKKTLAFVVAIAVAGAAAGWWTAKTSTRDPHRLEKASDEAGKIIWTCTMHPQVRRDHPGNCPICGMKLVPRAEPSAGHAASPPSVHAAHAGPLVTIDPRMAQNLGMRTAPVTAGNVSQSVDAVGSVAVDENRIAVVEARAAGWVERLDVRAVGDAVRAGQVLAGVYAPDLLAAQEELALARKLGDAALVDAAQSRLKLLNASGTGSPQRQTLITAPQSGVVTELMVRQGAQVMPGAPLMKLADLSKVWIVIEIPESQSAWVAAGQPAKAHLRGLPGRMFEGQVDYVYPLLDAATRTVRARLAFDNADGALKPGMYADVTVLGGAQGHVTLVPTEAVIRPGTRNVALVADSEGRYRPVEVTLGPERGDQIVVLSGLEPGQQVVVSGQFLIDSEASLLGAYERMGGARP